MCGVGALAAPGLDQPLFSQAPREGVEQQSFSTAVNQARAELAQDSMIEAGIGQRQTQRAFPVDPPAHGIGGLTVGQTLDVLQHRRQGEPPRRFGGLATTGNNVTNWPS